MDYAFPILEFDPDPSAIIEASKVLERQDIPERCVLTFFNDEVEKLRQEKDLKVLFTLRSEAGNRNLYEYIHKGEAVCLFPMPVGAPHAAGFLEEAIAIGCNRFVACGGAGVLDKSLVVGQLIVPDCGVRDEGTSYHYAPPSREIEPTQAAVAAICQTLAEQSLPFVKGKVWTTDGFFRETRGKFQRRKEEGCIAVEMEFTAFCAVARFRGVAFGQILYGGDDISGDVWDKRDWHSRLDVRRRLIELACESVLKL